MPEKGCSNLGLILHASVFLGGGKEKIAQSRH